jgi:YVTN family beta-propeller protein
VQSADISILSTQTLQPIGLVKVGPMPYGLATSTDGSRLFVANQSAGSVAMLDSRDLHVMASQKVGRFPEGLVVEPKGGKAYVANWFSGDVSVLDTQNGKELKRIRTGGGSRALAVVTDNPSGVSPERPH